mmetsp:Transcript_23060/g.41649  ORF Transcript_23060/g.41649 Transcript_23060/m.41649 type:complete len:284 (-) Transcript_23060:26-877(-)
MGLSSSNDDGQQKLFLSTFPPSQAESQALAEGLRLNGSTIMPPHFVKTGWQNGQRFTEEDDPDRMRIAWKAPKFIAEMKPPETEVEELPLPEHMRARGSFARVVYGVLSEKQCAELISRINVKGFTPALLNIGGGRQKLEPYVRNGHRAIVDSKELSAWLLEALRPHLPREVANLQLVELNERCRILCYTPGQEFASHFDGEYTRENGDRSKVTVQLYLHDVPEENGGATTFQFGFNGESGALPCQPKAGSVLLFTQDLLHEGSLLKKGLKYTLRTEAMYRPM